MRSHPAPPTETAVEVAAPASSATCPRQARARRGPPTAASPRPPHRAPPCWGGRPRRRARRPCWLRSRRSTSERSHNFVANAQGLDGALIIGAKAPMIKAPTTPSTRPAPQRSRGLAQASAGRAGGGGGPRPGTRAARTKTHARGVIPGRALGTHKPRARATTRVLTHPRAGTGRASAPRPAAAAPRGPAARRRPARPRAARPPPGPRPNSPGARPARGLPSGP